MENLNYSVCRLIRALGIVLFVFSASFVSTGYTKEYSQVQWVDLIPQSDLDALLNPPASIMSIPEGSEFDVFSSDSFPADSFPSDSLADSVEGAIAESLSEIQKKEISPEEQAYYDALESTKIKPELDKKNIRIAGFVVPLEFGEDQVITEFFLVPYFGACIHVPPPPPNQIVYVKHSKGLTLDALHNPVWVEGQMITEIMENQLAKSTYTLNASGVHDYNKFKP